MFRLYSRIGLGLVLVVGAMYTVSAQSAGDSFTFARPPAPASTVDGARLSLRIDRYSTDAERDRLLAVIAERGPEQALEAFRDVWRLGTLTWPGGLEYTVRFARKVATGDGGHEIVLILDRPLWLWWETPQRSTPYIYSALQLRLPAQGQGEGRLSLGVPVTSDKRLGIVLSEYATAPVVITDLRRARGTS